MLQNILLANISGYSTAVVNLILLSLHSLARPNTVAVIHNSLAYASHAPYMYGAAWEELPLLQ